MVELVAVTSRRRFVGRFMDTWHFVEVWDDTCLHLCCVLRGENQSVRDSGGICWRLEHVKSPDGLILWV